MGLMDLFNQGDMRDKLYAAAEKSNIPQGGVTGAAFKSMFPYGLGNKAFGREPEPMPDMASPQGTQVMAELVQNVVGPGTFIGPKGLARLFGDDAAKGMLATAESKLASGVPRESVFQELGVFKGPEGKWRYEIDDSGAKISMKNDGYQGRLPAVLEHGDVYAAYPDTKQIVASYQNLGSNSGEYSPLNPYTGQETVSVNPLLAKEDTLLHELQHAVQGREGLARGGSPNQWEQIANDRLVDLLGKDPRLESTYSKYAALDRAIEMGEAFDPMAYESLESALLSHPSGQEVSTLHGVLSGDGRAAGSPVAQDLYQRLAGEAESRAVQDRMNMTMPERRASFPQYATRDDLIVRGLMSGGE